MILLVSSEDRPPRGIVRVRAANPSPLTLDGTNTYIVAGWVVDPGPDDPTHVGKVLAAASAADPGGRLDGAVLTHDHPDHAGAAHRLAARAGELPVVRPRGGERVGPFEAIATPGHAPDHVCLLLGTA